MEETGQISQFKKWWNVLPAILFRKRIATELEKVNKLLADNSNEDLDLDLQMYEVKSFLILNQLKSQYLIIEAYMSNVNQILELKRILNTRKLRNIDPKFEALKIAVENIRKLSGKKIESIKDVLELRDYITEKHDRLELLMNKRNKEQATGERSKLMTISQSILIYLNMSVVGLETMSITNYVSLHKLAEKKMEQERKQLEQYGRH